MRIDRPYPRDPNEQLTSDLDWLGDIAEYNQAWFLSNAETVYATIQAGLNSEFHYTKSVEAILTAVAFALTDEDLRDWFEPISVLVENHPTAEGNLFQSAFREVMREFRELVGVYGKLDAVRPKVVDALLQAYIKLFKAMMYRDGLKIQSQLLDQAIMVSRKLGDHIEASRLNQTIALYYAHYGTWELAEPYARLAFNDCEFIDDPDGMVDAALTMATIYQGSLHFTHAEYYVKRAIQKVPATKFDKRYATLFYEYAVICYRNDKFELALHNYQRALTIFESYDAPFQVAMTQQAMAQAYTYLGEFDKAEANVLTARSAWGKLGHQYQWVNTFFVEADLELKRGNYSLGMRMLDQTLDRAYTLLQDTPARERLIELIERHIAENSNGAY